MSQANCLIITPQIKELTSKLQGETEESTSGLVSLWQKENNKETDSYPTAKELAMFRAKQRNTNKEKKQDTIEETPIDEDYNSSSFQTNGVTTASEQAIAILEMGVIKKRDRVNYISRLFSTYFNDLIESHKEELDRSGVLKLYTPFGIFSRVEDHFRNFTKLSKEDQVAEELKLIRTKKGSEKYTDEQLTPRATQNAEYKATEYQMVLDNFKVLAEEAALIIGRNEKIRIIPTALDAQINESNEGQVTEDGYNEDSSDRPDNTDIYSKEESFKDNWMTNYAEVSGYDSLSQKVRGALNNIPKLSFVAKSGRYTIETDDLGNPRYLDSSIAHGVLSETLSAMRTSEDMIPLLEKLAVEKPWVNLVIKMLQQDPVLYSQAYQSFRKDFVSRWIQKRKLKADGSYTIETIQVNSAEGSTSLIDEWRANYESGTKFTEDSVYNEVGDLSETNADKGLAKVEALNDKFSKLEKEDRFKEVAKLQVAEEINDLLKMIGINIGTDTLSNILVKDTSTADISVTDSIMLLLPQLNTIFSGIGKGKVKDKTENGEVIKGDLINTFSGVYKSIAEMLSSITEETSEKSTRENGKSYYNIVAPNYLGTMEKKLQGLNMDENQYQEMLEADFGQFQIFKNKGGKWLNDWVEQLATNSQMRKQFKLKNLLNANKVEYADWDAIDYTTILWGEYFSDLENKSNTKFANFHIPIMSDAQTADFLRFRKYDNKSVMSKDGSRYLTFKEVLIEKFSNLVAQEMNRMATVVERDALRQRGREGVEAITNYDIVRSKKDPSVITNLGGAQFRFLPFLNNYTVNGVKFSRALKELQKNGSAEEVNNLVKEAIETMMDTEFEETYREYHKMGLLEENPNGTYKHLGVTGVSSGQSVYNSRVIKALMEARTILGESWLSEANDFIENLVTNKPVNTKDSNLLLTEINQRLLELVKTGALDIKKQEALMRDLELKNYGKEKLEEYFWNSKYATSQIIQLTLTDIAYYKDTIDLQKRAKQYHSPAMRLNTKSEYGREIERTIYLKDNKIVSEVLSSIKAVLQARVNEGTMSVGDRDQILEKFSEVDFADAQAYRSLSSYRAIMDMSGQWTDEMKGAFERIQEGTWDINDINAIWQTKKPFVYTQIAKDSGVPGAGSIKMGVQHKNSEFLLLAMHSIASSSLAGATKLKAINEFMENHNIDVIQFESTVKVGKQGVQDINNAFTKEEVLATLEKGIMLNGKENPNVIHEISYEDYGIQVETPEHFLDTMQLLGTQIRKLVLSDISNDPDLRINVNGTKLTKAEVIDLYNRLNTENIIDSFKDVDKVFSSAKEVEAALQKELRGNDRYGTDMIRACTLNEKGDFNIPLFDPVISNQVQQLLNSIVKKNVTKQKIKGGALIQASSYGLDESLKIIFQDENGQSLDWASYQKDNKGATREQYEQFVKEAQKSGKLSIKHLEAYMPAYSREFFEPLMVEGTHTLDINKLPDSLRRIIGYRVPTEDKYSMVPIYIKGFLPQMNGSAIMLPAEITTLSGSDFDVDKLYVMFPEFRVINGYDKGRFADDLIKTLSNGESLDAVKHKEYKDSILEAIKTGKTAEKGSFERNVWETYKNPENKQQYRDKTFDRIERVNYDITGDVSNMTRQQRNNAIIDIMTGILTNSDTASKILNPGGFDAQKKAGSIVTILKNMTKADIKRELGVTRDSEIMGALKNFDGVDKLAKKYLKPLDITNPTTQVKLHGQNMMGASLISIYANHNANHALAQLTDLALSAEHGAFTLNGKRLTSLNGIMNQEKQFISKNNAGFLAAAVDNAKEAILSVLNQNTLTADGSMLLSRLGYTPLEISVFMNQPIILEITNKFFRESREGKSKNTIIQEVINEYKTKAKLVGNIDYKTYKDEQFSLEDLMANIINKEEGERLTNKNQSSDAGVVNYAKNQVAVGYLFSRILNSAESLSQLVQTSRADSQNGGAGPTIADTQIALAKFRDFQKSLEGSKSPLINANIINDINVDNMSIGEIRKVTTESKLPYLQAFHTLGVSHTETLLGRYFPQYSSSFKEVIEGNEGAGIRGLRKYTKYDSLDVKTMNSIYNDLLAYIMSGTEFFGSEKLADGTIVTSRQRRNTFINNFPQEFAKVVADNPEIAELDFIKRLRTKNAYSGVPVDTLRFSNVGNLSAVLKEQYSRDWQALLSMGPEAANLAVNLFRYAYYRNGFAFNPNSFMHLTPNAVREVIPGYLKTLRELTSNEANYSAFIEQYIYNHLDNTKFVPVVKDLKELLGEDVDYSEEWSVDLSGDANGSKYPFVKSTNSIILNEKTEETGTEYTFMPFVSTTIKGKPVYYRATFTDTASVTYTKIEPLGIPNQFIEYEYGKQAGSFDTVIRAKESIKEAKDIKAEAQAEYQSAESMNLETAPDHSIMYSTEALKQGFAEVFGEQLTGEILDNTLNPNQEFLDVEGNPIC